MLGWLFRQERDEIAKVGDKINVPYYFFIENIIGYDHDAAHADNIFGKGYADESCVLEIRGFEEANLVVSLQRPFLARRREAANGTVFLLPHKHFTAWVELEEKNKVAELARQKRLKQYCK